MELVDTLSLLVVGAILAAIGQGITGMVFGKGPKAGHKGWRGVFYVTMWAHPILAGALLGLVPDLPAPEFMGEAWLGGVLWYALAGVFSSTAYDGVSTWFKQRTARNSQPPPPGGDE
jgi:hypothetical protein